MNELIAGKIAAPKDLPADAVGSVGTPNTLPADSAGIVGTPNTVPSDSAGIIAAPIALPSQGAAALPRSLTPMVDFDFAAKRYVQDGVAVAFEDIFNYTRPSSATFTNRRAKKNGGYEYFLDTDYVGSVENLLKYSEDFSDTALWSTNGAIITNTAIAPDGTLSADHLQEASISSAHSKFQVFDITAGTYTRSIYAKAAERSWFYVKQYDGVTNYGAWFNLTTGTVGLVQAGMTAAMEPVGDGWFKCSITNTTSAVTERAQYGVATNDGAFSYLGTAGLGVYIWGAQFTESAKPLPYVKTLDVAVTKTFAETLRTEYDAVTGKNLGALIEGSSTNLLTQSEDIIGTDWIKINYSATTAFINSALAPDKTMSGDKFVANTVSATHQAAQVYTFSAGQTYTFSVFLKQGGNKNAMLTFGTTSNWEGTLNTGRFDLQAGVITTDSSENTTIQDMGDGWFKCSITSTAIASLSTGVNMYLLDDTNDVTFAGNNVDGVYAWGAQLEAKPFASSYIRTEGAAVSRSSDNLNIDGNSSLPDGGQDLTISIDVSMNDAYNHQSYAKLFRLDGQPLYMQSYATSINNWMVFTNGISLQFEPNISSGVTHSFATTYTSSKIASYFNSVETGAITTFTPTFYNRNSTLSLGASGSSQHIDGHISKFKTYAQALTAQEITLL